MDTPILRFLGWDRPALELVADALLQWNATREDSFRRSLVVVPTAESGRQLREYMAERAGRPLLMPRTTLMGLLIPGNGAATEAETLAAWMQVLGRTTALKGAAPRQVLEIALPLLRIRKQLERENHLPDFSRDEFERFAASQPQGGDWTAGIEEEVRRWESLRVFFTEVDRTLEAWGCQPAEKVREAAMANPSKALRGRHLIVACVPEVSPQHRRYLRQLAQAGVHVEIWVNAPASERAHLDEFGQPLAEYWASCPIDIPSARAGNGAGSADDSHIHVEANARAMALKARTLAGGSSSRDVTLACCDPAFAPSLVTAFAPEWKLNLPEGRSLMTTSAALLPAQLAKACQEIQKLPLFDDRTGKVIHGDALSVEAFLELARNPVIQQCYGGDLGGLGGFSRAADELLQKNHPARVTRLLEIWETSGPPLEGGKPLPGQDSHARQYATYGRRIHALVQGCADSRVFLNSLAAFAHQLEESFLRHGEHMQQAVGCLLSSLYEVIHTAGRGFRGCSPAMALELWRYLVEKQAAGALEEMRHDETVLDVVGWRELSYARGHKVLIAAMHDGCVPEPAPQDANLPDAFRRFMKMSGSKEREARDAFILTALLQGHRGAGQEVHFLLSRSRADGSPAFPSSLLLRCERTPEGRQLLAARADYFFRPSGRVELPEPYDRLHLLDTPATEPINAGEMESICLIAPGATNRYARPEEPFSPSRISEFLHCPLRFWLRLLRGICPAEGYSGETGELSPLEYGTVLHDVLREVVSAFPSRPSTGSMGDWERQIRQTAHRCLAETMLRQYGGIGETLPLPLYIQQKSMEISLSAFARCHAADIAAGWETRYLEYPVRLSLKADGQADIRLDMRLDRVDCHPDTGCWRIIDYKTNDMLPAEVHVATVPDGLDSRFSQCMPGFKLIEKKKGGNTLFQRWKNVQLPLYAWALQQQEETGALPETGYYNLPKNHLSEVEYTPLLSVTEDKHPFSQADVESALDWVREVARLVRAGQCLYSAETLGIAAMGEGFGALCPEMEPREMCGLPPVKNINDR